MEIINLNEFKKSNSDLRDLNSDYYYYYELSKKIYPKKLCSSWSFYTIESSRKRKLPVSYVNEEYRILREVSEYSFYHLYREYFNPVSISITRHPSFYEGKWRLIATIHSIDDTAYKIAHMSVNNERSELELLRDMYFEYIESNTILDCSEFIKFGLELGGVDESY